MVPAGVKLCNGSISCPSQKRKPSMPRVLPNMLSRCRVWSTIMPLTKTCAPLQLNLPKLLTCWILLGRRTTGVKPKAVRRKLAEDARKGATDGSQAHCTPETIKEGCRAQRCGSFHIAISSHFENGFQGLHGRGVWRKLARGYLNSVDPRTMGASINKSLHAARGLRQNPKVKKETTAGQLTWLKGGYHKNIDS